MTSRVAFPSYENYYIHTSFGWRRFFPDVGKAEQAAPEAWVLDGWALLNVNDHVERSSALAGLPLAMRPVFAARHGVEVGCWLMASEIPPAEQPQTQ